MAKIIDTDGLAFFKDQQDAANEKKFVKSADIVDGNGIILADKLPANFGADVIAIHVVTLNNKTKFYNDRVDGSGNHVTCPNEVQGEVGKIYIDLESGSKDHYVYDAANNAITLQNDGLHVDISGKADKVSGATAGNIAGLDANGNLTDSGVTFAPDTDVSAMLTEVFGA